MNCYHSACVTFFKDKIIDIPVNELLYIRLDYLIISYNAMLKFILLCMIMINVCLHVSNCYFSDLIDFKK